MPSTDYSDVSTVQLSALLMRNHDPYYGFSFCDRLVNMSKVSGIPNALTCFVSFNKIIWLEAWDFDSLIPKRVLYVNLGTTRLRSRPRNR